MYAEVYVPYPVDTGFTYRIPAGLAVAPGTRVRVDFRGRELIGFVHRVHDVAPTGYEVKDLSAVIDAEPVFDDRLLKLADMTARAYLASIGEVLSLALPSAKSAASRYKYPFEPGAPPAVSLTPDQETVARAIMADKPGSHHLIFGITGSGKTEIYIELAKEQIAQGRSVIYLVPEISLSSQIFERLFNVFGSDLVIYNSSLTGNQRLHNWKRFYAGEAKIAVGTRSAIFMQCPALGLVIIDEEHDGSYKEHSTPRYNARRIALFRSKLEGATVVMGSATPSVESRYAAEKGIVRLHRLDSRYGSAKLPEIEIVRIKSPESTGLLSPILKVHTKRSIDAGNQVIYLLNRRGFAPLMLCDSCGEAVECPHCNISMNYHNDDAMHCHYCGHTTPRPARCPKCGAKELAILGSGTQRMEKIIEETFRGLRIFRLDQDSSRLKDTIQNLIEGMAAGEIDILMGTQLVAKGFDFPRVTLVGVILADIGLNMPDYRASERIFSLLMQAGGRAGRGEHPGRVIVQTLNEKHPIFEYIKNHDYDGFYRWELDTRRLLGYPPFTRLVRLLVRGADEAKVAESIGKLADALRALIAKEHINAQLLGPTSAPFAKIGGNFRHHLIVKTKQIEPLRGVIQEAREVVSGRGVYLEIDVDPIDLM